MRVVMRVAMIGAFAFAALCAAQFVVRPSLDRDRPAFSMAPAGPAGLPAGAGRSEAADLTAALGSTLGVARPLAINLLALRAGALESEGRYFESLALTRGITTLLPRLPRVWSHEAMKIAYDVAAEQPPRERFGWVVRALEMLRDDALAHNPRSPRIYATISLILLQRIGASANDDLAASWAERFEEPVDSAWREAWLGREATERLVSRYLASPEQGGVEPRSVYTHVLHWCDAGLAACGVPRDAGERAAVETLRHHRSFALRFLCARGLVVRPAVGRGVAFVPDLRYAREAFASFREEMERYADTQEIVVDIRDDLARFTRWHVVHRTLWGDETGALAAFAASGLEGEYAGPTSYVLAALRGGDEAARPPEPGEIVAGLLGAEAGLLVARVPEGVDVDPVAAALRALAERLHAESGDPTSFAALRAGGLLRAAAGWRRAPGGDRFSTALIEEARASGAGEDPVEPGPGRLPGVLDEWRLDALRPEAGGREP